MDHTAIEQIQESAAAVVAQAVIVEKADHEAVLVPKGYELRSLEALNQQKDHFCGNYETFNQDAFVEYCIAHDAQKIFVDGEAFYAQAFFDLGNQAAPGHAKHRATLRLKKTAAFVALERFADRELSQQDAAETLEDWGSHIEAFDADGQIVLIQSALAAVRDVKISAKSDQHHSRENLSASRSLMESIEASSEHQLPATLYFICNPYLHLEERRFMLRVSVITRGSDLLFKFRLADMEQAQEEMAEEFTDSLVTDLHGPVDPDNAETPLPANVDVYIGTFDVR